MCKTFLIAHVNIFHHFEGVCVSPMNVAVRKYVTEPKPKILSKTEVK